VKVEGLAGEAVESIDQEGIRRLQTCATGAGEPREEALEAGALPAGAGEAGIGVEIEQVVAVIPAPGLNVVGLHLQGDAAFGLLPC